MLCFKKQNIQIIKMIPASPAASRGHRAAADVIDSKPSNTRIPILHYLKGHLNDTVLAITRL